MPGGATADIVILCGGLGTRLKSAVSDRPKPMAAVGGEPFLRFLMERAIAQGFSRFILCVGHMADSIVSHFRALRGLEIIFSREDSPLGTAGALKLCAPLRRGRVALVMNGDSYCAVPLRDLLAFHDGHGGVATIAVGDSAGRRDAGSVDLGPNGRVQRFSEKSREPGRLINAGVYALGEEAFDSIPAGRASSLEAEIFPALLPRGVFGYRTAAPIYDIGTPERLEAFRAALADRSL